MHGLFARRRRRGRGAIRAAIATAVLVAALAGATPAAAVPALGTIATVAGGIPSGSVDATSVGQQPVSVATVTFGGVPYVYAADQINSMVTRVNETNGSQELVAGIGAAGFSGDGGPATSAEINRPSGVAVDNSADLYIADGGARVRFVPGNPGRSSVNR